MVHFSWESPYFLKKPYRNYLTILTLNNNIIIHPLREVGFLWGKQHQK